MKVCMITSYPPVNDGVGDCSAELVRSLKKLYKNLDIRIITHKSKVKSTNKVSRILTQKKSSRTVLQIVKEILGLSYALPEAFKTWKILANFKPKILHIQYEPGLYNLFFSPIVVFFAKLKGIKTLVTLHGRDYFPLNIFHRIFLYSIVDKIIVHTETHKKILPDQKKVHVVPMGINRLGKNKKNKFKRNLLFFGYLSPHKGLENLLLSFKEVLTAFPDAKLLIYGPINPIHEAEIKYKNKIIGLAKDLGISKSVKFTFKFTPRKMLPKIDSKISVFPYLKSYSAGQSAAVLDSIAAGKAVIVTKVPGLYENVKNGKNGIVIEPGDNKKLIESMKLLLSKPKMVEKISRNNLKLAKSRTWDHIAKKLFNIYTTF
jgi:glycosyltransferase involved in cell wall biosynthesis